MSFGRRLRRHDIVYPEDEYELTEDGQMPLLYQRVAEYQDGSSIDWIHAENLERERSHGLQSQEGVRGILLPILDSAKMWFIVVMTGVAIGFAGAWLDILVKWYTFPKYSLFESVLLLAQGLAIFVKAGVLMLFSTTRMRVVMV